MPSTTIAGTRNLVSAGPKMKHDTILAFNTGHHRINSARGASTWHQAVRGASLPCPSEIQPIDPECHRNQTSRLFLSVPPPTPPSPIYPRPPRISLSFHGGRPGAGGGRRGNKHPSARAMHELPEGLPESIREDFEAQQTFLFSQGGGLLTSTQPLGSSKPRRALVNCRPRSSTQCGSRSLTRKGEDSQNMCLRGRRGATEPTVSSGSGSGSSSSKKADRSHRVLRHCRLQEIKNEQQLKKKKMARQRRREIEPTCLVGST